MGARNDVAKYQREQKLALKKWVREHREAARAKTPTVRITEDNNKTLYHVSRAGAGAQLFLLRPEELEAIKQKYTDLEIREADEFECTNYALQFLSGPCSPHSL